jgi:hypothetical protein
MIKLDIKPLSINEAYDPIAVRRGKKWIGQLIKSKAYTKYKKDLPLLLPPMHQLPEGKLVLLIKWHFKTAASDYDNPIKPMQDLICDYYGVNDNKIYMGIQQKLTGYNQPYISFEFLQYHDDMFDKCRDLIIKTD